MRNIDKWNVRIRLELAIVLVLFFLIIAFWAFPQIGSIETKLPPVPTHRIQMIRMPRTIQKVPKKAPPPMRPSVPVPSDELEILDEIPLKSSSHVSAKGQMASDLPLNQEDLPYIPRQIVEVLPRVNDLKVKGEVTLKLLIDTQGKVKDYKVLSNSTHNPLCLKRVIEAARKSRWEVIVLGKNKMEYWLVKQYRFGK